MGQVWTTNVEPGNTISQFNSAGGLMQTVTLSASPANIFSDALGQLWVPHGAANTITKLNSDGSVNGTFSCGSSCYFGIADADNNIWVSNVVAPGFVSMITNDGSSTTTYSIGDINYPYGMCLGASDNIIVAVAGANQLISFDLASTTVMGSGDVGYFPENVAMDAFDSFFSADSLGNTVTKLDSTGNFVWQVSTCNYPGYVLIDQLNRVWVSCYVDGTIVVLDNSNGSPLYTFSIGASTGQLAMDSWLNIYVASPASRLIAKLTPPPSSPSTALPTTSPSTVLQGDFALMPGPADQNCPGNDVPGNGALVASANACAQACLAVPAGACVGFAYLFQGTDESNHNCWTKTNMVISGTYTDVLCYALITSAPTLAAIDMYFVPMPGPPYAGNQSCGYNDVPGNGVFVNTANDCALQCLQVPNGECVGFAYLSSGNLGGGNCWTKTFMHIDGSLIDMTCYALITSSPSNAPTARPSRSPTTHWPTRSPTRSPTHSPTRMPVLSPTHSPQSAAPSHAPTKSPSSSRPSKSPTHSPSRSAPTRAPTRRPSRSPTSRPSASPIAHPTTSPTFTGQTYHPSRAPTTARPSRAPTSSFPTRSPSSAPTVSKPTYSPTGAPTARPSRSPSQTPTSSSPSMSPSSSPSRSAPTAAPQMHPTLSPSHAPTSSRPSFAPTRSPLVQDWYKVQNATFNFSVSVLHLINDIDFTLNNFTVEGIVVPYGRNVTIIGHGYRLMPMFQGRAVTVRHGASLTLIDVVIAYGNASYVPFADNLSLAELPAPVTHDDGVSVVYPMFVGGAILNLGNLSLDTVVFDTNLARAGGAVFNWGTITRMTNCVFRSNKALSLDYGPTLDPDYPDVQAGLLPDDAARSQALYQGWLGGNPAYLYRGGGALAQVNKPWNMTLSDFAVDSIANTVFENNSAGSYGGAIHLTAGSIGSIVNSTFTGNTATQQPLQFAAVTGEDVLVMSAGGAISVICQQGASGIDGGNASLPVIVNSVFTDNEASSQIYAAGGALYVGGTGAPGWTDFGDDAHSYVGVSQPAVGLIRNCTFTRNRAVILPDANTTTESPQHYEQAHGGAIAFSSDIGQLDTCTFTGNQANANMAVFPVDTVYDNGYGGGNGGAIASVGGARQLPAWPTATAYMVADHLVDATLASVTNCTFTGNVASYQGGAVAFQGGNAPVLTQVTFVNNSAGRAGALSLVNSLSSWNPDVSTSLSPLDGRDALNTRMQALLQDPISAITASMLDGNVAVSQCSAACVDSYGAVSLTGITVQRHAPLTPNDTSSTGALSVYDTPVVIGNCSLLSNTAGRGGALYMSGGYVQLSNSAFADNIASQGGAIFSDFGSSLTITSATFTRSTALSDCLQGHNTPQSGQCFDGVGGAIYSGGSLDVLYTAFVNSSVPNAVDVLSPPLITDPTNQSYISVAAGQAFHTSVGLDVFSKILGRVGGSTFNSTARYSRFSVIAPAKRFYTCLDTVMCGPSAQCLALSLPFSTRCVCSEYLAGGAQSAPYDLGVGCVGFDFKATSLTLNALASLPANDLSTPGTVVIAASDSDYDSIKVGLPNAASDNASLTYAFYYLVMTESYFTKSLSFFQVGFVNQPQDITASQASRPLYRWAWRPRNATSPGVYTYQLLLRVAVGESFMFNVFAHKDVPFAETTQSSALTTVALQCPPGYHIEQTYTCQACAAGLYGQPAPSTITDCTQCPADLPHSAPGASQRSDCVSLTGALTITDSATGTVTSVDCPAVAVCDQYNTTALTVVLRFGYWRALNSSLTILTCLHPHYCWGGNSTQRWWLDTSLPEPGPGEDGLPPGLTTSVSTPTANNNGSSASRRALDAPPDNVNGSLVYGEVPYCRPGHTGALCESCLPGFYLIRGSGCYVCDATASNPGQIALQLFVFFIIIVAVGALFLYYQKRQMQRLRESSGQGAVHRAAQWLQDQLVKLKILLGLAQVAASFAVTFGAVYPEAVLDLMQRLSIVSLDFASYFSFGCAATVCVFFFLRSASQQVPVSRVCVCG